MKKNQKYKHVIWDWNGTLLDDTGLCMEIMNRMLFKRDLPLLSLESYKEIFGFPIRDYYLKAGFDFIIDSFDNLTREYLDEYDSRCTGCNLHSGATDLLQMIQSAGMTQSVLSASNIESLKSVLRNYKIDSYFSHISGLSNNYAESKISIGKNWLSAQKFCPGDVVIIGDTEHDYETAQAMGIDSILISHGHQSIERLGRCNVTVCESLIQLKQML